MLKFTDFMKQTYFSPSNIEQEASEMLQAVERFRRGGLTFTPRASALLVLDMQDYFLEPGSHAYIPSAPAILPGIRALAAAYAQCGLPLVFTQHVNTRAAAGMMDKWWRELILEDHPLAGITKALDTLAGRVVQKSQYDAFYQTNLEEMLNGWGTRQVVICGVMTHLCCETTARSAFMRGFEVFFTVDGTATYNQDFHAATLLNLAHGFATLVLTGELLAAMEVGDGS
jgi:isochorismate hydrolase